MQGMKPYLRMSQSEREQIFLLTRSGLSLREIARKLGRTHTSISREYKRHGGSEYSPVTAHSRALTTRSNPRKSKLDDPMLKTYVIKKLGEGFSPEQIAGRLKYRSSLKTICHETIYSSLYRIPLKKDRLWEFLRCGHKKREQWFSRRSKRAKRALILGKVPITDRPEEAKSRSRTGHWETDLMEGSRKTGYTVSVTVDRKSGAVILDQLPGKESRDKMEAMVSRMERIPLHVRKTMTFDNGLENTQHQRLHSLRMKTYFCSPYHSWEKGTVENTIGLIRQYLPKGSDLSRVSQSELRAICQALNDRPRKRLGYRTPNEVLLQEAGWCVTS